MLESLESIIRDTEEGADFYYNYDSGLSDSDNIEAFYHALLEYFHISEETLAQTILIGVGIFLIIFLVIWILMSVIQFAIGSFVGAPIGVGFRKYFMKNRQGQASFDDLFSAFSGGHYIDTVKSMFSTNIRIWGWSLLFYFPGLVKYYEYYFVAYIIYERVEETTK